MCCVLYVFVCAISPIVRNFLIKKFLRPCLETPVGSLNFTQRYYGGNGVFCCSYFVFFNLIFHPQLIPGASELLILLDKLNYNTAIVTHSLYSVLEKLQARFPVLNLGK